jgi:hypothetical protein
MAAATVLFVKLTGAFFAFGRRFFLKDTARRCRAICIVRS